MTQPDVPMVISDPGLNGTPGMTNEDFPTLAEGSSCVIFPVKLMKYFANSSLETTVASSLY
jgi:hypothetical protein